MPDDYRRPTSAFWEEWRTVMLATQATLSRYRSHCIRFTVNPVALAEATRQSEFKQRKKAVDRANSHNRRGMEMTESFPPLIIPH